MSNTQLCWMIGVPTVTVILTALDTHLRARQLDAKFDRMLEKKYAPGLRVNDVAESVEGDVPNACLPATPVAYDTRPHEEFRAILKTRTK